MKLYDRATRYLEANNVEVYLNPLMPKHKHKHKTFAMDNQTFPASVSCDQAIMVQQRSATDAFQLPPSSFLEWKTILLLPVYLTCVFCLVDLQHSELLRRVNFNA